MTGPNEIDAAVSAAIAAQYPDETIYTELAPKGFERPSFLVECMDIGATKMNQNSIEMTGKLKITCFVAADVRGISQFSALSVRGMAMIGLLLGTTIASGDQVLRIEAPQLSGGYDFAEVTATVTWYVAMSDITQIELPPVMETVALDLTTSIKEG